MIKNQLQPTGDQVRGLRDRADGEPIYMLNLLKFAEKASYPDGADADLSGVQAYERYSVKFIEIMAPKGVKVTYAGEVRGVLIGDAEGAWDSVAVIEYPNAQVMLDMLRDPEYQAIQIHRAAGLEGQMLIECGKGFSLGS